MVLYLGKMPIISMYVCYYILVIESSSLVRPCTLILRLPKLSQLVMFFYRRTTVVSY